MSQKPTLSYYAKRFVLFFLATLILNFLVLYTWKDSEGLLWIKILFKLAVPFSLAIIMSRTTFSPNWKVTLLLATVIVYLNCISMIVINLVNPFDRTITPDDYRSGIKLDLLFHTIFYLPIASLLAIIIRKRGDYYSEEENQEVIDN